VGSRFTAEVTGREPRSKRTPWGADVAAIAAEVDKIVLAIVDEAREYRMSVSGLRKVALKWNSEEVTNGYALRRFEYPGHADRDSPDSTRCA
jgi:hypothetical protein